MKHATSRMLFSYWDSLRDERSAPERGEVQPGAIRQILGDTIILEVGLDRRANIRLAGTRCCALFGQELKGRSFASLWRTNTESEADDMIQTVAQESAGIVAWTRGTTALGATIDLELVLLPLCHGGKTVTRILGSLSPASIPSWLGIHAITSLATTSMRIIEPPRRQPAAGIRREVPPLERRQQFVVHLGGRM